MEDHIREKCELCPVPCSYKCGTLIIKKLDLQEHLETCVKFPVRCPNNCEAVISREMIPNHIEDDCPLTTIPCPYARIGCSIEVQRDQLESHLQHETRSHLDLACSELNNTQQKVKEKTIQVDRLKADQKTIQKKLDGLEKRLVESVDVLQQQQRQHQNRVNVLRQEYQEKLRILEQTVNNTTQTKLKQKLNTVFIVFFVGLLLSSVCLKLYLTNLEDRFQNNLDQKVSVSQRLFENDMGIVKKYLEDSFQNLEKKVGDFQSQHKKDVVRMKKNFEDKVDSFSAHFRVTEESRKFTWKIRSFAIKLKQAKNKQYLEIVSDPFYMYGYKFKLSLYPNGNGDGENTHLSVFIYVMKGKYDAILPWPFKKKVKFTLVDQQEDPAKRENVIMQFIPRPTQEKNIGRGYYEFISHEKLHSRRYLVDDTLFLQVEIDPPFWS